MSDLGPIAPGSVVLGKDFLRHRIIGNVPHAESRGMPSKLDVPLIGHVYTLGKGELWQGGCPDYTSVNLPSGFDYVLSLYPWGAQYGLPRGCDRDIIRMYDSLQQSTDQVNALASDLALRVQQGQRVLVHCQAGLNRSGLVAGATLVKLGINGDDAVQMLRDARCPIVLCNETFENYVCNEATA